MGGGTPVGKPTKTGVKDGSGNIFADLGFRHPAREQLKAELTLRIYRLIQQRRLTQAKAGELLGIRQPHVSALINGRSGRFSVERLFEFLNTLGQDVEVAVRPKPLSREFGQTSVLAGRK